MGYYVKCGKSKNRKDGIIMTAANIKDYLKMAIDLECSLYTQKRMIASLQDFAKKKLNLNPRTISADFPWNRFFEIDALVSNTPKYPLYLTAAEKYRRFEEEQKKKAAEEKSKKESAVKGKNGLLKKDTISNDSEKNASQIITH